MERFYWAALSACPGVPLGSIPELVSYFGSAQAAYQADKNDLAAAGIFKAAGLKSFLRSRSRGYPEKLYDFCRREQVQLMCYTDRDYPVMLKAAAQPPAVLYIRGQLPDLNLSLAMVGSRQASAYGLKAARAFAGDLAAAGLVIISGGAKGIDTASHEGALEDGGSTVAVLGCGIDISYPAQNRSLFARIAERGAVVTEFPPHTAPTGWNFPRRNRIISGLSRSLLVVEAAKKSGAMITVEFALDEGREVYCIPGSIFLPNSAGCHSLLKSGAKLVDRPEDILEDYFPQGKTNICSGSLFIENPMPLSDTAEKLLNILTAAPLNLEELVEQTGLPPGEVNSSLLDLQLLGRIGLAPGPRFYRI